MTYDAVLCVSSAHTAIAQKAIRSLVLFSQARKIFVITSSKNNSFFQNILDSTPSVFLLDEDKIIGDNIDLHFIQSVFQKRIGSHKRAGWYFQQFLKMAACNLQDIASHYLIWDSDTLMLSPISFFNEEGRVFINPKTENHKPYFDLMVDIIGLKKQVDFSFISEHFMIRKSYMRELIAVLGKNAPNNTSWVEFILGSINDKDLPCSGFSEYETYGNFIASNHKESYICRHIKSRRYGTKHYGTYPSKYEIFELMRLGYFFATFERRHKTKIVVVINKAKSRLIYAFNCLTNRCSGQLKAAAELCRYVSLVEEGK